MLWLTLLTTTKRTDDCQQSLLCQSVELLRDSLVTMLLAGRTVAAGKNNVLLTANKEKKQ